MAFVGQVDVAVRDYLRDPTGHPIPYHFRRLIREVQEVCPKAGNTTRALALHCFGTNRGNRLCPYHGERDKTGSINDYTAADSVKASYKVMGIPFRRIARKLREEMREGRDGVLDCGCLEDDMLLDFYWWKVIVADSVSHDDITEGWKDQRLDPRARLFMRLEWEYISGLTVDSIYTNGKRQLDFEISRYTQQIKALQEYLEETKEKLKGTTA